MISNYHRDIFNFDLPVENLHNYVVFFDKFKKINFDNENEIKNFISDLFSNVSIFNNHNQITLAAPKEYLFLIMLCRSITIRNISSLNTTEKFFNSIEEEKNKLKKIINSLYTLFPQYNNDRDKSIWVFNHMIYSKIEFMELLKLFDLKDIHIQNIQTDDMYSLVDFNIHYTVKALQSRLDITNAKITLDTVDKLKYYNSVLFSALYSYNFILTKLVTYYLFDLINNDNFNPIFLNLFDKIPNNIKIDVIYNSLYGGVHLFHTNQTIFKDDSRIPPHAIYNQDLIFPIKNKINDLDIKYKLSNDEDNEKWNKLKNL